MGERGFTVTEFVVVLAVLGVLVAIAVPNFLSWMPGIRLNGAARQVMGDLMSARMKGVSLNRKTQVFFYSNHQYKICDDADNNGIVGSTEGDVEFKDIQGAYPDVTLTSTNNPIFLPRGTATNLPTVTLTNSSGSRTITISITGRVKIS